MKWLMHLAGLTLVIAAGTWIGGWWMVPVVAGAYGAWGTRQPAAVLTAMLAGGGAWGLLLAYDASVGPVLRLTQLFGTMFRMSGMTLVILTVAYAALLAVSAAAFVRGIRRLMAPA
ncbi:MAG: hypothetical protein C0497_02490 [Gemmatimonas sp.]|nr:hypothetical protein [Gemmatimonas sp.]